MVHAVVFQTVGMGIVPQDSRSFLWEYGEVYRWKDCGPAHFNIGELQYQGQ